MKKYVKPELFYERYELTEQIADCAWEWVNSRDENNCTLVGDSDNSKHGLAGFTIFVNSACEITDPTPEIYCYTTGAN